MSEVVQQYLVQLALNAIPVVVPLVIAVIVKILVDTWAAIQNQKPDLAYELRKAAEFAVAAAEQVGMTGQLKELAESKLEYAIGIAQGFLAEQGLGKIDLELLRAAIEAEVLKQFPAK